MTENKEPMSLNQRHSRLLKDFSAQTTHPSPMFKLFPDEPEKPLKVQLEGRRRLCKTSMQNSDVNNDAPTFSGITDFDSPPSEKIPKNEIVVLEGRQTPCEDFLTVDKDNLESNFSESSDFNSPCVAENINGCDFGGANEIRSILNDLNSKLESLSIEKQRPKKVDSPENSSLGLFSDEDRDQHKTVILSTLPDSKLDVASHYMIGESVETKLEVYDVREDLTGHSEDDDFVMMNGAQIVTSKSHIANEARMGCVKNETIRQPLFYNVNEEIEEEDGACVTLSNKGSINGVYKGADRQYSKFNGEVESSGDLETSCVVDVLDDEYVDTSVSEDQKFFTLCGPNSTFTLDCKLAKMLYPHQREGLKWLWSLHCQGSGGILGDDMGLGKTMQICAFLVGLFRSRLIKRALIVAPKTLLSLWIKELSTVGLSDKIKEYFGTCARARQYELQYVLQDKGVLLTTYDIVRNNSKSLCGDHKHDDSITWDYMILDEGHLIKNPSTQRAKSLLEIPSAHRIIISGTPIQNNLKELWALFHFCCPGLLHDKNWFKEKYEYKILRGNDKHASDRDKRIGSATAKELRDRIQPYFLRRLKSEVFLEDAKSSKISKKNEIIVWLKLTSCQRQLYEAFLKSELVLSAFDGSPLAALTILKKICDHPLLLTKRAAEDVLEGMDSMLNQDDMDVAEKLATHIAGVEGENFQEMHDNVSCKISFIMSLLAHLIPNGHNVLIFSQTKKMLNLIQESLTSNDFRFLRIDGTTKASDRVTIVNNFQEGYGAPIFLLTSQVGGLGLTLTKADRVIVVDPAWNPSTDNQSVDRAYRIGQMKDVLVYRLMTCGTVEEKIYKKQIFKGGLFKTATEHKEQTRYFSQQDLKEVFSLPRQGFDISLTQQQLHEEHDSQYAMEDFLKEHIRFLESKGIAGVSHHSLLFSKTAPTPITEEEEEREKLMKTASTSTMFMPSKPSHEHIIDGNAYTFNPNNENPCPKNYPPKTVAIPTESDLKERIARLSQVLADKGTISRLPDKGARIRLQIAEFYSELEKMKSERKIIDLEDVTEELERKLTV